MENNNTQGAVAIAQENAPAPLNLFSLGMFREAWTVAEQLAKSKLIPKEFQNNPPDCIIAMEMAQRIGAGIFPVMQSLYIVHGKPGWSAQFIIAALNSCGRFSPLRFDMVGDGDDKTCTAWSLEKVTGERLTGPSVSIDMAKKEGWYSKNGSKWQTMPELMLRYRAATFFGRLYAPDILMGMRTAEELHDTDDVIDVQPEPSTVDDLNARFSKPGKETINTETGEITKAAEEDKQEPPPENPTTATPPRQAELKEDPPPPKETQQPVDSAPETQQAAGDPEPQPEPGQLSARVKSFMKEINQAAAKGSIAVDTWRSKHHNRVANACGGMESEDYWKIMDYAEMTFRELEESEKEQKKQQGGGASNGSLF